MKLGCATRGPRRTPCRAFALLEVVVAMAIVGTVFLALYSGMTYGFSRIRFSREELRATQILMEKMETIRLYNWDQINDDNYIPKTFSETYAPDGSGTNGGVIYSGTLTISDPDLGSSPPNYKDSLKEVTVTLNWKTGGVSRSRTANTLVAENGLYSHVYNVHYH